MKEFAARGVLELRTDYARRVVTPTEVVEAILGRIKRINPQLHAFIHVDEEQVLNDARNAAEPSSDLEARPLHGIPVCIKDNIDVAGAVTTAASRVLNDAAPAQHDAEVVRRLRTAGAIVLGKNNLYEFAAAYSDPSSPFGIVDNPRRLGHQAGGSSNGSAAAVAAGLGVLSIGTDAGGSIRHPASACGVVGLMPTQDRLPRAGIIPTSYSLGHVGIIGRTVADVAVGFRAVSAGRASAAAELPIDLPLSGLRLGSPDFGDLTFGDPKARELLESVHTKLVEIGMQPVRVTLPLLAEVYDTLETIALFETALYHRRFRDRCDLYGEPLKVELTRASELSVDEYLDAQRRRAAIREAWFRLMETIDVLLLPSNTAGSPPHDVSTFVVDGVTYPIRQINSGYNRPANLVGLPALAIPVGMTSELLPIAAQLITSPHRDEMLLRVGNQLEAALGNLAIQWGIDVVDTMTQSISDSRPHQTSDAMRASHTVS